MFDYPNKIDIIFDKLSKYSIKPIIVGGYIRDKILQIDSKDIDIEVYGLDSLSTLEDILKEFGDTNMVGKSFGVCKLFFKGLDLDFSLPRTDSKISSGHRGFKVITDKNLDFTSAAERRDFRINAMGYDVLNKTFLDPYDGLKDIQNKILNAVNIDKFAEDPLRVLRGIQFSSRFHFSLDSELFALFKTLVANNILQELPRERIYEELKKMFLKSSNPSIGLKLLEQLKLLDYFGFTQKYESVDYFASRKTADDKTDMLIFLSLLYTKESYHLLDKLTNKHTLLNDLSLFLEVGENFNIDDDSNYALYSLANKLNIKIFLLYMDAYYVGEKKEQIIKLREKAIALKVLTQKLPALLQGKELISFGLTPSKKFSLILQEAYEAQMEGVFNTLESALKWLETYLDG